MSKIKFGIEFSFSQSYDALRKKVLLANTQNWDSIWIPDHLSGMGGFTSTEYLSLWPMFGSFAELAKGKVFGSSVTDPHRIHPAVLAQIATTINHISGGNFILGIGAGEGMNLKAYNIPHDRVLTKMSEFIKLIRLFWEKGKRVTFEGEFFRVKKANLLPKPLTKIPIWMASHSPKTLELTGEITDGWLPISAFTEYYKAGKEIITKIIKKNNRNLSEFTFAIFSQLYMHNEESKIEEKLRIIKSILAIQPRLLKELGFWKTGFDELFYEATGYEGDQLSILKIDSNDLFKFDFKKLFTITDQLPNEKFRSGILVGTKEEIIKKIQKYINAGVQHFIFEIWNGSDKDDAPFTFEETCRILSDEIIPLFK